MKIIRLLCLVTFAAPAELSSQTPGGELTAHNAVYLELLGNGYLVSINYDRLVTSHVSLRVGFASPPSDHAKGGYSAPVMVNFLSGRGNSHFEAGAGVLLVRWSDRPRAYEAIATATVGYRYQRPGGGFVFRVGATPLLESDFLQPWAGISLGYAF